PKFVTKEQREVKALRRRQEQAATIYSSKQGSADEEHEEVAIKEQYHGIIKRKICRLNDAKLVFDWDVGEYRAVNYNPIYKEKYQISTLDSICTDAFINDDKNKASIQYFNISNIH
ncbi:unnamed protein product, partial [Rotaria sp. Silwood2]